MIKNYKIALTFLFFLVILVGCKSQNTVIIDNGIEKIQVNVEIADTPAERTKGLMFRQFLDENSGMLFIFENEDYYGFWMKNTLIPLDIIFIDRDLTIVDIIEAEPCEEEPCESYSTTQYSRYILEVNQGFAARNNIEIGNKVTIEP